MVPALAVKDLPLGRTLMMMMMTLISGTMCVISKPSYSVYILFIFIAELNSETKCYSPLIWELCFIYQSFTTKENA